MNKVPGWVETSVTDTDVIVPTRSGGSGMSKSHSEWESKYPIVVTCRRWDVEQTKATKILPIMKGKKKKRRIRIELRRSLDVKSYSHNYDLEQGVLPNDWAEILTENDIILVKILKRSKDLAFENESAVSGYTNSTAGSISTIGFRGAEEDYQTENDSWLTTDVVPITWFNITKREHSKCTIIIGRDGSYKRENNFSFMDYQGAKAFENFAKEVSELMMNRSMSNMRALSKRNLMEEEEPSVLVEVVSASNLLAANRTHSDPYVVVFYGGEEIHRTAVIKKDLDPIWTLKTKSHFLVKLSAKDVWYCDLTFEVRDYETFVEGASLGQVVIDSRTLLKEKGERKEYKLISSFPEKNRGRLALRIRQATSEDSTYVESFRKKHHKNETQSNYIAPPSSSPRLMKDYKKRYGGVDTYRVRPKSKETEHDKWMSTAEIEALALEETVSWVEAGSGNLGVLYLEIIGCNGLPDADKTFRPDDVTDAFVTTVFEDAVISTDVVQDCLNPRFLPWTRRGFKLNVTHATSQIFLGVFDYDGAVLGVKRKHDPIGRCRISLQHFAHKTSYLLTYDLYDSAQLITRKKKGTITVRLQIDWSNTRQVFFDPFQKQSAFQVNMEDDKDFNHVSYTVRGKQDVDDYSMEIIFSLLIELGEYGIRLVQSVTEGIKTVLLWRGHYTVKLCHCPYKLPLHSMTLFTFGILYVEIPESSLDLPDLSLTLYLATISWLMIALLAKRRERPCAWGKPPNYWGLLFNFIFNRSSPQLVTSDDMKEEDELYQSSAARQSEDFQNEWRETLDQMGKLGEQQVDERQVLDTKNRTPVFAMPILKQALHPIQLQLVDIMYTVRYVRNIVSWEYPFHSFWLTTIPLILAILSVILIEYKILFWIKRIIVWVFFGPWMKIIDVLYYRDLDALSDAEREEKKRRRRQNRRKLFKEKERQVQIKKEEVLKLAALREKIFGDYIMSVPPTEKPQRFDSTPLLQSTATPLMKEREDVPIRSVLLGQKVSLEMRPDEYMDHMLDEQTLTRKKSRESTPLLDKSTLYGSLEENSTEEKKA